MGLKQDENVIKNYFVFMIFITLVFMFVFTYLGLKVHNEDVCKRNFYGSSGVSLTNSSYRLDGVGNFLLTEFFFNKTDNLKYDFCFGVEVNSSSGLRLRVVDEDNNSLATQFVVNSSDSYCTTLDESFVSFKSMLGVSCDNCNSSSYVTVLSELVGRDVLNVYYDGVSTVVSLDNKPSFLLIGRESCRSTLKFYWFTYMMTLFVIGFIGLLVFGIKKFQEELYKGF